MQLYRSRSWDVGMPPHVRNLACLVTIWTRIRKRRIFYIHIGLLASFFHDVPTPSPTAGARRRVTSFASSFLSVAGSCPPFALFCLLTYVDTKREGGETASWTRQVANPGFRVRPTWPFFLVWTYCITGTVCRRNKFVH